MANEIKLKRGSGSDPSASDLVIGEIAIRTDTGKLFTKKDDNSVAEISGGGIDDGDKGDITVSNGGATFTIDNGVISTSKIADNAVTYAKFGDISTNRLIGRISSGDGNPETLTAANVRSIINVEDGATADQSASEIVSLLSNQNIATTGTLGSGDFTLTGTAPKITFTDSNDNPDYLVQVNGGTFLIHDATNGADKFKINSDGHIDITPNADFAAGIDVTGNISVSGTVDGRDVAADGTKLDGIASGATNVTNTNQLTNGAGFITATLTNEQVQDIVGGMVSGNTESGITVTYQDGDGTLDFSVASQTDNNFTTTLKNKLDGIASGATNVTNTNQLTNGAGFITATLTNEQVQDIVGGMLTGNTETGITVTYQDGDGTIDFVVGTLNQNTTGNAATATKLATARTIAGVSFDGSANISLNNNAITNGAGYLTSVGTSNIANDAVTGAKIAHSTVAEINLQTNAVTTSKINNGAVTNAKIDSMAASKLTGALPAIDGSSLTGISAGATGGGSDEIFYENGQTVTTNYTITNGKNAMSAGPITINSGVTVTVGSGETLTIV